MFSGKKNNRRAKAGSAQSFFGSLVICVTHISLMNKLNEKYLNYSAFLLFSGHNYSPWFY